LTEQPSKDEKPRNDHVNQLLEMNTDKFLKTSIIEYLKAKSQHATCISCQKCIRPSQNLLQFKYSPQISTQYKGTFKRNEAADRSDYKVLTQSNLAKPRVSTPVTYRTAYAE
jgi:hypothetical protein